MAQLVNNYPVSTAVRCIMMTLALTLTLSNSTLYCNVLYTEDCLFCTQRNQPHLLSGLLLLLALVALVAQLVSHLPAGLHLLLQPVGHGFSVILQLPLLLEKRIEEMDEEGR